MEGIKIKIDKGNVSIDITEVKDKLIEVDTNNLLIEHINEVLSDNDFAETNNINPTMDRGNMFISGGLMGVTAQVYFLGNREIIQLKENGKTTLQMGGGFEEYIDTSEVEHIDFLKWFYYNNDVQEVVQAFYEDCGWEVTDIDNFQARKELEKGVKYLFREHREVGPGVYVMYESEMNINDHNEEEIIDACGTYGYEKDCVKKWLGDKDEIPLILECLFELES
jgi:hypothetical protein